jgi:hypothetical protein
MEVVLCSHAFGYKTINTTCSFNVFHVLDVYFFFLKLGERSNC